MITTYILYTLFSIVLVSSIAFYAMGSLYKNLLRRKEKYPTKDYKLND
jgi:hypothetical protein